jgi:integrase/recombinase XerD
MVSAYQLWLCQREHKRRGGTISISTQRSYLNAVRSFFAFAVAERIVLIDPARNVELPKPGRRLPRGVLSPKEMRNLLRQPNLATYTGLRDRAILETFYSTGIRHIELLRLRICDVDLDRGYVTVLKGKFKKDRVVPLGKVAAHFIREYITKARPHMLPQADTPETHLFLSINGTPLASASLYGSFRRLAKLAGLEKRLFPHGIRHTCATAMLRGRADIRYIQQMLGHESLSSTQIYTHVEIGDLKRVHARSHPREIDAPADPEWD